MSILALAGHRTTGQSTRPAAWRIRTAFRTPPTPCALPAGGGSRRSHRSPAAHPPPSSSPSTVPPSRAPRHWLLHQIYASGASTLGLGVAGLPCESEAFSAASARCCALVASCLACCASC